MSNKRAYFGDLRLWYAASVYTEAMPRTVSMSVPGIDRDEPLHIPTNPNFDNTVEIHTVFLPYALTQEDYRARVAAMLDWLRVLAAMDQPLHPLVWVADNTRTKSVDSYTQPVVTSPAHGFAQGDVVLIRRDGLAGAYEVGYVNNPDANTFEFILNASWASQGYTPNPGDDILLAERVWGGMSFQDMAPLPLGTGGDYYNPDTVYTFRGSRHLNYTRTVVDLDEDMDG